MSTNSSSPAGLTPSGGSSPTELCLCGHARWMHRKAEDACDTCKCQRHEPDKVNPEGLSEPPLSPEEEETVPEDPGRLQRALRAASEMKDAMPAARRPPYSVNYAAGGRQFQVLLPGDCSVRAEDGALIIRHSEPVAAITDVAPWRD